MAWVYESFDGAKLPIFNTEADLGTPTLAPAIVPALGGLWDTFGSRVRVPTATHQFQMRGIFAGATAPYEGTVLLATEAGAIFQAPPQRIAVFRPEVWVETEYDLLVAKLGVRGQLIVRDPVTSLTRSKLARLLRVERQQRIGHRTSLIEVACLFESVDVVWK